MVSTMAEITLIGGNKGGVGKTIVSMATAERYISQGQNVLIIDVDNDNKDVYKSYRDKQVCEALLIDWEQDRDIKATGWSRFLNSVLENLDDKDIPIVINTGARSQDITEKYGNTLNELENFRVLWVIDDKTEGLIALKRFLPIVQQDVCIVKNGYFGAPQQFAFERSAFKQNGIPHVLFPSAVDCITHALYDNRKAIHELDTVLKLGERILAKSWAKKAIACVNEAFEKAAFYDPKLIVD